MTIRWLNRAMVDQFHLNTLQEQGGSYGYLNEGNLDAALARPENLTYYEGVSDLFELAARYCVGITQAHAYVDGNKRTAFIGTLVFLRLNGHEFKGDGVEAVRMMEAIASGTMPEAEVVTWLKTGCA